MNIKVLLILIAAIALRMTDLYASEICGKDSITDTRADSTSFHKAFSEYKKYLAANDFIHAYGPWKNVFTQNPLADADICQDGTKILHRLMAGTDCTESQHIYFQLLMKVYDRQLENIDSLNMLPGIHLTKGNIISDKAHDYVLFAGSQLNTDTAYVMLKEAVKEEQPTPDIQVLQNLVEISLERMKENSASAQDFLQDYLTAMNCLAEIKKKTSDPQVNNRLKQAEDKINSCFIASGTAGCEKLQAIFGPEIESHRNDLAYLKQVLSIMEQLKCTNESVYYEAAEAANAIEPTTGTALGCAYKYYKEGDTEKSLQSFNQAAELETDTKQKANIYFQAAVTLYRKKYFGKARDYAEKALSCNSTLGKAYILIAQMYASSPNWSNEATLNRCTYYAAIDKLMKAKETDPNIAEEAQKLITTYASMTPKDEDLFFLGLKKGNAITIGGWIKETTTIK